jgi:hypothetical protein
MNRLFRALTLFSLLIAILHAASCSPDLPDDIAEAYASLPDKMDYNLHVKPILSDKCFSCHGPDMAKQQAGLRLDLQSFAFADLPESPGKVAIDPGDLNGSELFHRILSDDPDYKMPSKKSNLSLSANEKAILIKWIREGAEYKTHWAFVKPEKAKVPSVKSKNQVINPIDNFVLQKLELENFQPSKEAKKELLLRRLSLDLTGLPPTLSEIASFLNDNSPEAYEKQVDRLLKSPHYGEKMAVNWLDLARFADSHGYTVDRLIDMSPYRDWVIQAFNKNMPYDQFLEWQLAGDLMPKANKEMMIATAFNRLHQQNMEGGIIEEEFQTEYVIDRVNTTGIAVMGLPIGCARCHDHKYDPISQKNYYEMFSFFNRVKEAGQISWDDATPSPTILLPSKEQEKIIKYINNNINKQENKLAQYKKGIEAGFQNWINSNAYRKLEREIIPLNGLQAHFTFSNGSLKNSAPGSKNNNIKASNSDKPVFEKRDNGNALVLNGDQWFDLNQVGVFKKSEPFTINISVFIPKEFKEGVIFHKCISERLYNFRGYHLYLKDNKLTVNMSHAAPSNAISRITQKAVPRNQWLQLTMTYDGSSKANGLRLFQNGGELNLETTMDQLTKDILMNSKEQPGLQIGAWDRGLGFKGGKVDDIMVYNRELTDFEIKIIAGKASWASIIKKRASELSASELNVLNSYYSAVIDQGVQLELKKLKEIRTQLSDSTEGIQEVMVMQDSPQPKKTFLLKRGNYDSFGEQVFPNTPESILPFPKNLPKNRLGLAQWLTDENHPLTARVSVNRYWQNFFGTGLVKTSEDFGNQGELPSHPELLDWLAVTYRESGWDNKKLCKLIVMSATYRQDSRAIATAKMKDPENRLLSHGPTQRMSAEMIRDNALMASGLLNKKIGGKSVKPYQPDGLWEINNTSYKADSGNAVYRRSLYILVKRSVPNPTLNTFDATTRSYCVVRRQSTNTPLQSLVLLNDPTFVEASKVMGQEITSSKDTSRAISDLYNKLTGIRPSKVELDLLKALQSKELQKFRADLKKTKGWLSAGQFKVDKTLEPAMVAANAVVASVILNSDATLTKR